MARIVSDFDGTITQIPSGVDIIKLLASGKDYLDNSKPNPMVCDLLRDNEVIVVTGREDRTVVWNYCRKHGIRITRVETSPVGVWQRPDAMGVVRAHKKRLIESLDPDLVVDDDQRTLDMLDVRMKLCIQ